MAGARFAHVFAQAPDDVWAAGYRYFGDSQLTLVEHWDGQVWSVVPSPNAGADYNFLLAVLATGRSDVWAAGYHYPSPDGLMGPLIEHWDGSRWTIQPTPRYSNDHALNGLSAVAHDDAWAVGSGTQEDGFRPLVIHWDGKGWSEEKACNLPGTNLTSVVAFQSGGVWAVGQYPFSTKDRLGSRVFIERHSPPGASPGSHRVSGSWGSRQWAPGSSAHARRRPERWRGGGRQTWTRLGPTQRGHEPSRIGPE